MNEETIEDKYQIKEISKNLVESVTDKCANVYYSYYLSMPQAVRNRISCYILDNIFKYMVIPAIDEARRITREDAIDSYTDLQLVNELVKRNPFGEAPSETKRHGVWHEALIEAGCDETISITFPDEALKHIKRA